MESACTAAPPLSSLLALGAAGAGFPVGAQSGKSALNLAMVAEPPTLDIQSTPADLVCIIMQHVYEPLLHLRREGGAGADAGRIDAEDLGRRQDLHHHAAQGRQAAQRPRPQCRRRGGQPEALDGGLAARQVGGSASGRPHGQGAADRRDQPEERLRAAAVAAGDGLGHGRDHGQGDASRSRCANSSAPAPTSSRSASPTSTCC